MYANKKKKISLDISSSYFLYAYDRSTFHAQWRQSGHKGGVARSK